MSKAWTGDRIDMDRYSMEVIAKQQAADWQREAARSQAVHAAFPERRPQWFRLLVQVGARLVALKPERRSPGATVTPRPTRLER